MAGRGSRTGSGRSVLAAALLAAGCAGAAPAPSAGPDGGTPPAAGSAPPSVTAPAPADVPPAPPPVSSVPPPPAVPGPVPGPAPAPALESAEDRALAARVERALATDPALRDAVIEAVVRQGQVTLNGTVPGFRERARAIEAALRVPGVRSVRPRLVIQQP